jgi:hypothetical protein
MYTLTSARDKIIRIEAFFSAELVTFHAALGGNHALRPLALGWRTSAHLQKAELGHALPN